MIAGKIEGEPENSVLQVGIAQAARLSSDIAALLTIDEESKTACLRIWLDHLADHYRFWLTAFEPRQDYGPSREKMRQAAGHARKIIAILREIDLEAEIVLDHVCREQGDPSDGLIFHRPVLERFQTAADETSRRMPRRKGAKGRAVLHNTVGTLIGLFQILTGNLPVVQIKQGQNYSPRLVSAEAKAIGLFIQAVDAKIEVTTIVDMISRILREHPDGTVDLARYSIFAALARSGSDTVEVVPTSVA